jgi:DNA-binding response OmpR family regulator
MKRHLVVIDDEKVIHSILDRQLPVYDFKVHGCESGKEGLKYVKTLIKTTPIDVILLDWMMPHMSGLDVLAKLKCHRLMRDIPVFMLTSKSKLDDIDKAYDMGADNYITKPFSANSIGSIINLKLSKLKKRKELTGVK